MAPQQPLLGSSSRPGDIDEVMTVSSNRAATTHVISFYLQSNHVCEKSVKSRITGNSLNEPSPDWWTELLTKLSPHTAIRVKGLFTQLEKAEWRDTKQTWQPIIFTHLITWLEAGGGVFIQRAWFIFCAQLTASGSVMRCRYSNRVAELQTVLLLPPFSYATRVRQQRILERKQTRRKFRFCTLLHYRPAAPSASTYLFS